MQCVLIWLFVCVCLLKKEIYLTLQSQRGHPLKLWFLEPSGHPLEGLTARLELAPGLRVPQEVRQSTL